MLYNHHPLSFEMIALLQMLLIKVSSRQLSTNLGDQISRFKTAFAIISLFADPRAQICPVSSEGQGADATKTILHILHI